MKKTILNLGKNLNKTEQKKVTGGRAPICPEGEFACFCPVQKNWACSPSPNSCV